MNLIKKSSLVTAVSILSLTVANTTPVLAVNATITPNPTRQAERQARQQTNETLKKTRADEELDRRITALNGLITKINAMKKPTADQKSAFIASINTEITTLQTLKAKIDADTDLATLKTDKQSIVNSYRVFALFIPQINIMTHADAILDLASQMQSNTTNTASLAKITDATTQANNAYAAVSPLSPSGYPGNKTTLQSARQQLKTALADLKSARTLMKTK